MAYDRDYDMVALSTGVGKSVMTLPSLSSENTRTYFPETWLWELAYISLVSNSLLINKYVFYTLIHLLDICMLFNF